MGCFSLVWRAFILGYVVWGAFFPRIFGMGVPEFLTRKVRNILGYMERGCQIS